MSDSDIEDEIFQEYLALQKAKIQLSPLTRQILIENIFKTLKNFSNYAIIGGEAFNIYVKSDYKIITGDIDIKVFKITEKDYHKWTEKFFDELKNNIQDYNLSNLDYQYISDTFVYQLVLDIPVLDIGYYKGTIAVNQIEEIYYAKPQFLLDQLVKYQGFAAGAGLFSKEGRRIHRKRILDNVKDSMIIFDNKIHQELCKECKN